MNRRLSVLTITITILASTAMGLSQPVTIWHWETPPARVAALDALLEKFAADTGLSAEQVPTNFGDYQTKILAALAANQLPEILMVNPPQVPLLLERDAIIPLDDLAADLDAQYGIPAALSAPYQIAGTQYGIPVLGVFWPLTYRADLYEAAGLEPPDTWDELRHAAEALTIDENGDGNPEVYGVCLPVSSNGNYGSQVVWAFLRSNGGDIVEVVDGQQNIVFDSPETVETYRYLADLAQFSPPGKENFDWGATELLIKSGKCANVMYNGAWMRELAENDPELLAKYAMKPMPVPEGGQAAHTGYPRALVVTRAAEQNMDSVMAFLSWLYQPENHAALLMMEPGLFMPVTRATAESDAFLSAPVIAENQRLVSAQASIADSVSIIGFTGATPAPSASQLESSFTLGKVLQRIVLEGMSPEDAVTWGADQYRDIIR